jgi:hypothetical protein
MIRNPLSADPSPVSRRLLLPRALLGPQERGREGPHLQAAR